jgi:hypothetical protein
MCDSDRNRLEAERFNIQHVLVLRHALHNQAGIRRFSAWSLEKCMHYILLYLFAASIRHGVQSSTLNFLLALATASLERDAISSMIYVRPCSD